MVIKSMTGFGRGESVSEEFRVIVEIKAVNHRYCDISIKLPKKLISLETKMRSLIKSAVSRGKLDVFVTFEDLGDHAVGVRLSETVSRQYYEAFERLSDLLNIPNDATAMRIGRLPEVLTLSEEETDLAPVESQLTQALTLALDAFSESRIKEGNHLKEDILGKLDSMGDNIRKIEERYPQMLEEYRGRLLDKVHELLHDKVVDENRIAAEVVVYADKICVDEETVRLHSHIDSLRAELERGGSVGRKLDFIAQELNREANTILSKANDKEISDRAIDLKTDIEKVREQVQNIE